jgi:hypothetical protein
MPNAENVISDGFASDAGPRRKARFTYRHVGSRPPEEESFSGLERLIPSSSSVMETLRALEFNSDDLVDEPYALDAVLAGGDIETTVGHFFSQLRTDFRQAEASVTTRSIGYPNDLFKREPFFGVVQPFHSTSVAAAIRKRPDLVTLMGEWYRVFDALHIDDFPESSQSDVSQAADDIIGDVLKFATFKQSKLPTMTVMVGQHLYQIKKRGSNEGDTLGYKASAIPGAKRQFHATRHRVVIENLFFEGRALSASLLIDGNRVLAMGIDDATSINQVFERTNLHNLSMVEHVLTTEVQHNVTAAQKSNAETASDFFDFEDSTFDLEEPEEPKTSLATKNVPLTEEFFDLIARAVDQTCNRSRAILTARVLITDSLVRIFAYDGVRLLSRQQEEFSTPPKLDDALLRSLRFANFEDEIADVEKLAGEAMERRILTGCLEHLEFDDDDRLDPVEAKMVEILVSAVKGHFAKCPVEQSYQAQWGAIETANQDGQLYKNAVRDRQTATIYPQTKLQES